MRPMYYRLDGGEVVPATMEEAAAMFENSSSRIVEQTTIGDYWISTVFLPLDHSFGDDGPPVVFETMAFDANRKGIEQDRYCTWEEAEAGHATMVARYKRLLEHGVTVVRAMRQEFAR